MLKNLRIRTRMIMLVALLIAFTAVVGEIGQRALNTGSAALATLYADRIEPLRDLKIVGEMYEVNIADTVNKALAGTVSNAEALDIIHKAHETANIRWEAYLRTYLVDRERAIIARLTPAMKAANEAVSRVEVILLEDRKDDLAKFVSKSLFQTIGPVYAGMSELIELQISVAKEIVDAANAQFERSRFQMIALLAAAIVLGLIASWYVISSITGPIAYVRGLIERMSRGDLSVEVIDDGRRDETGEMARATAEISRTLRGVSSDLRELIEAARAGTLSVRADPAQHKGEFAELVTGANALLATLAEPLQEVAAVMAKLAAGDLRGRMTGDYAGELRALKGNVNRSLDVLVTALDSISEYGLALANGDVTQQIEGNFQGEFASMRMNLNKAAAQLNAVLVGVGRATSQMNGSATETTAAAVEVSRHASSQMATLVEVSAAIEQTASAIGEIAASSNRARGLAKEAVDAAEGGQATLTALGSTVQGIADKTARITQISELISSIADKTYVLALNAGLEAARADANGGGFGLIANKISSLAEEVAQATRDIRTLVHEAAESVNLGVEAAAQARVSMGRIVGLSQQSGEAIHLIAAASEEQSAMANLLKASVMRLQTVGQTTASAAEEISATMKAFSDMAQRLKAETDRIRTA